MLSINISIEQSLNLISYIRTIYWDSMPRSSNQNDSGLVISTDKWLIGENELILPNAPLTKDSKFREQLRENGRDKRCNQ